MKTIDIRKTKYSWWCDHCELPEVSKNERIYCTSNDNNNKYITDGKTHVVRCSICSHGKIYTVEEDVNICLDCKKTFPQTGCMQEYWCQECTKKKEDIFKGYHKVSCPKCGRFKCDCRKIIIRTIDDVESVNWENVIYARFPDSANFLPWESQICSHRACGFSDVDIDHNGWLVGYVKNNMGGSVRVSTSGNTELMKKIAKKIVSRNEKDGKLGYLIVITT